jgi:aspartate-semialdehyde dehydrogenase
MSRPLRAAILGATGAVGQKFVRLLQDHPWFEVAAVVASQRSAGRTYRDAVHWMEGNSPPSGVANLVVQSVDDDLDCDLAFSALDSLVASVVEPELAAAGIPVISNASALRMDSSIPLIVPEVNPDHLGLLDHQTNGAPIVTNPNCATVGLVMVLKPLHDAFGIDAVHVTTLQAVSGAGYPGLSALDILGDAVPLIPGEEDKLRSEPQKILGRRVGGRIEPATLTISAQTTRVPVLDGHLLCVSIRLRHAASPEEAAAELADFRPRIADLDLPSAPERPISVLGGDEPPTPRRHASVGEGMTVTIGRIRRCPVHDIRLVALVNNTIRGAAGAAILNAELMLEKGLLRRRTIQRLRAS